VDVGSALGEPARAPRSCITAQPDYRKWPELFPPLTRAVLKDAAAAGAVAESSIDGSDCDTDALTDDWKVRGRAGVAW
jgi:hypothetical protein